LDLAVLRTLRRSSIRDWLSPPAGAAAAFRRLAPFLAVLSACAVGAPARAVAPSDEELGDLSLEELHRIRIVTPSRVAEPLEKTAATVSVITGPEIGAGTRTIAELLARVPGIVAGIGNYGDNTLTVRGIHTTYSEKVLVMLDGHVLNDGRSGSATFQFLDRLPLDNVARVEVVRSPGSALYGANAMLAVVNVITRRADEATGVRASAGTEWDRRNNVANRYDLLLGGAARGWKAITNVQVVNGSGPHLPVAADALGYAGNAAARGRYADFQSALEHGPWRIAGRYLGQEVGDYFGVFDVLNGGSNQEVRYGNLDVRFRRAVGADADLTLHAYGDHQDTDNYYVVLPAGSIPSGHPLAAWNGTGFIGETLARELTGGAEAQLDRRLSGGHLLSTGAAYRHERLYDPRLRANFDPAPLATVQDVSDRYDWIRPGNRDIASAFAQDLWDATPALRLTLGARIDHFSDFGSTFNPRVGLSLGLGPRADARLAFGSAFRAPDFVSLYARNNPITLGNPALRPETARTTEAGLTLRPHDRLRLVATAFYTELRDLIDVAPAAGLYENLGSATTKGFELEGLAALGARASARATYAFAAPEFSRTSTFAIGPRHSGVLIVGGPVYRTVRGQLQLEARSEVRRSSADARPPLPGYALVGGSVTAPLGTAFELQAAVLNLLDRDYRHPAPPLTLPGDFPGAGRSVVVTLRAHR
jgi:iron complex outermembrane receptor protein